MILPDENYYDDDEKDEEDSDDDCTLTNFLWKHSSSIGDNMLPT